MAEEDGSAFEIVDYTVASPWERLVARLEDIVRGWGLARGGSQTAPSGGNLSSSEGSFSETVSYAGRSYGIMYHTELPSSFLQPSTAMDIKESLEPRMNGMLDPSTDFPARAHHLQRWFGLSDFLLITPLADAGADAHEATQLLSTMSIVLDNARSSVPVFVPLMERRRHMYVGYMHGRGVSIKFNSEAMGVVPAHLAHLDGLVDFFFKRVLATHVQGPSPTLETVLQGTSVSTRFTYVKDWLQRGIWRPHITPPGHLDYIYWGPSEDPLAAMHLALQWPTSSAPKNRFWVDNSIRTDYRPMRAPLWSLRAVYPQPERWAPLAASLKSIAGAYDDARTFRSISELFELIGMKDRAIAATPDPSHMSSASNSPATARPVHASDTDPMSDGETQSEDQPHESRPQPLSPGPEGSRGFISAVGTITRTLASSLTAPLLPSPQELDAVLQEIFTPESAASPPTSPSSQSASERADSRQLAKAYPFKAAPPGTLVSTLGLSLLTLPSLAAIALLWVEFVKEVRWYWEHTSPLPRVPLGQGAVCTTPQEGDGASAVDLDACLIYQKLQMLNYCIYRKEKERGRDTGKTPKQASDSASEDEANGWSDDDIYFSDEESTKNEAPPSSHTTALSPVGEASTPEPQQLLGQKLLYCEKPLVVPETQDPGPLTEDMIAEQQEVLSKLGTNAEAAAIRARMQTVSLSSDMQAFKAANPGCVLEDFVRWHSPRDWDTDDHMDEADEEEDQAAVAERAGRARGEGSGREGTLSRRMRTPGNLWRETWQQAPAAPAVDQEPIFRCTREAEKVLHYLEALAPLDLVHQLASVALVAIGEGFSQTARDISPQVTPLVNVSECVALFHEAANQSWPEGCNVDDDAQAIFEPILQAAAPMEVMISRAVSLVHKLPQHHELVTALLSSDSNHEVAINSEAERSMVSSLFSGKRDELPDAHAREFLVRTWGPRPFATSAPVPSRMYALLTPSEFKVAMALGTDDCI
eukprot:TRINITY_DN3567_c0_g1_i3.p1 TRINITY_DN3567_c0_g1~~TRINITY_DN3567_c0_g1_i3.p1  ORF type:complete len:985 (-),score=236.22 TRINITY_DN3567_c0_g1_i3:17-2971(-)